MTSSNTVVATSIFMIGVAIFLLALSLNDAPKMRLEIRIEING